jgi:YebC/PmpR family DNA-binding regulatory protein
MSGHNKWSKIKHKKGAEDAKKSKIFSKLSRLLTSESKRAGGDINSPSLLTIIEKAKKENVPKDVIERAIKKGTDKDTASMDYVLYEAYGPGGCAIIIEGLTDNKNRTAGDVRHILSKNGVELATQGSASWAFTKKENVWEAEQKIQISDSDGEKLGEIIDLLEDLEDIQNVYTNAE